MKRIEINRSIITLLYNKHKDYIVPIATIIVSFMLLVLITIPQISNLLSRQQEIKFEREKLTTLKNNLKVLSELNESILDSQLGIATDALPLNKNFSGVLNEISITSNKAGVFLGDFEFQVGDLSNSNVPTKGFPNLELSLAVNGNAAGVTKFIDELYKSFPIVEITKIDVGATRAQLNTLFYYKPYLLKSVDGSLGINQLSKNDLDTLKQISSWNSSRVFEQIQPVLNPGIQSTSSAF